jgi:hypothetical protein
MGVYVFGGLDRNNIATNRLYALKVGNRPVTWERVRASGEPPTARHQHTMTYMPQENALIVFGGRVDKKGQTAY